jgi:hypothetical protein
LFTKFTPKQYSLGYSVDKEMMDDDLFTHLFGNKHKNFKGRRYRRGKNRCSFCGAKTDDRPAIPLHPLPYCMSD